MPKSTDRMIDWIGRLETYSKMEVMTNGSCSSGVLGSAQVVELRRLDAQADALGRLVDQARLDRGGACGLTFATLSTQRRLPSQQDAQV